MGDISYVNVMQHVAAYSGVYCGKLWRKQHSMHRIQCEHSLSLVWQLCIHGVKLRHSNLWGHIRISTLWGNTA